LTLAVVVVVALATAAVEEQMMNRFDVLKVEEKQWNIFVSMFCVFLAN